MQQSSSIISQAVMIRARLRRPPNAVPDRPISLERVRGVNGYEAARLTAQRVLDDLQKQIDDKAALLRELSRKIECASAPEVKPISVTYQVSIRQIQLEISRQWDVDILNILSSRRTADVVVPRQVGMVMAKKLTKASLPEIGRRFGNRDHTTVIHALKKYAWLVYDLGNVTDAELSLEQWVSIAKAKVLSKRESA